MALIINTSKEILKYIPIDELEEENPFTLLIKLLDAREVLLLEDSIVHNNDRGEVTLSHGRYAFNTCKASIVGWENIYNSQGEPIPFIVDGSTPSDTTISALGVLYIQEVATVVIECSKDNLKIPILFQS